MHAGILGGQLSASRFKAGSVRFVQPGSPLERRDPSEKAVSKRKRTGFVLEELNLKIKARQKKAIVTTRCKVKRQ